MATATNLAETNATLIAAVESVRAASAATIADLTSQLAAAQDVISSQSSAAAATDAALDATVRSMQSIAISLARLDRITDDDVLQLTCRGAQYISADSECLSCTGPGPNDGHIFNRVANSCQPCTEVSLTWAAVFRPFPCFPRRFMGGGGKKTGATTPSKRGTLLGARP